MRRTWEDMEVEGSWKEASGHRKDLLGVGPAEPTGVGSVSWPQGAQKESWPETQTEKGELPANKVGQVLVGKARGKTRTEGGRV